MKIANKKLYRSTENYILAGVCAGLGDYFNMNPVIFRILFIILTLSSGIGVLLYLILMIILPKKGNGDYSGEVRKKNAKGFVNDLKVGVRNISKEMKIENLTFKKDNKRSIAIILVILGFILFFNQIFPMNWFKWDLFWPLIIIFIGFWILFNKN